MTCDICRRGHHPQRLPFFCAVDARNALYEGRFANVKATIEMDELEQRISSLLLDNAPNAIPASSGRSQAYIDNCVSEEKRMKDRTEQVIAAAEQLQKEIDTAKKELEDRKAVAARRKAELASASQGTAARRKRELEETKTAIRKIKYHWDRDNEGAAQYRAGLCTEVAKLYRLQRVKKGNPVRYEYRIGGVEVVDLYQINSKSWLKKSGSSTDYTRRTSGTPIGLSGAYSTPALVGLALSRSETPG